MKVLHIYDANTGTTTNLGLAGQTSGWMGSESYVFGVSEAAQGGVDLNGDGDAADRYVLHLYDVNTQRVTNLGISAGGIWRDGDLFSFEVFEDE